MLVLSRYRDESIYIGDDIVITVVDIRGDRVRIGVEAPNDVSVHRQEVYEAIKNNAQVGSDVRKVERKAEQGTTSAIVSPLGRELNKQKAKKSPEANGLPINFLPPIEEFGGLADIVPQ